MNEIINIILLSILPVSELRGAIPYGISNNINPLLTFFIAVLANFLVAPFGFFFLDNLHKHFLKIKSYNRFFNKYIEIKRKSFEKHVGTSFEFWALMIFVAIPLPLTGAYSGALIAWFFDLKRRKSYLAIFLGILIAGIIVTLTTLGIRSLF
ncbi:MAG: small multi-drug export protein [Nanoarchaeota archaeon]